MRRKFLLMRVCARWWREGGADPVGETQNQPFQLSFNAALRIEFQGSRVTSDGGLILVRELDERLGFSDLIAQHLTDPRGTNTQFPLADLVRQSVYRRLAGYEDVNDAERLSHDPTFRLIGSEQIWERGAALTSRVHSFETELLTQDKNLAGLAAINRELIARVEAMESSRRLVLDIDSTEVPVYGQQEQSAYNGHFESTCYHPLMLFNREGDCLAVKLRPGNVHSAEDWDAVLLPEIERQQTQGKNIAVRADAGFAKPELYEALEVRGVKYAIRIPSNDILEREVAEMLKRSVGRPGHKPVVRYKSFRYQAGSWKSARPAFHHLPYRRHHRHQVTGIRGLRRHIRGDNQLVLGIHGGLRIIALDERPVGIPHDTRLRVREIVLGLVRGRLTRRLRWPPSRWRILPAARRLGSRALFGVGFQRFFGLPNLRQPIFRRSEMPLRLDGPRTSLGGNSSGWDRSADQAETASQACTGTPISDESGASGRVCFR